MVREPTGITRIGILLRRCGIDLVSIQFGNTERAMKPADYAQHPKPKEISKGRETNDIYLQT